MNRTFGLSLLLLFAVTLTAQASVQLSLDDEVRFLNQSPGQSAGYGGAFDWLVTKGESAGQTYQTFCVELSNNGNAYINYGWTYKVSQLLDPAKNSPINDGKTSRLLGDTTGIYAFDQWSKLPPNSPDRNPTYAAAVQVALWRSIGYSSDLIQSDGGIRVTSEIETAITQLTTGWSDGWKATNEKVAILKDLGNAAAQDQIFFVATSNDAGGLHPVPEPTTIAIWGVGVGLAGAAALRRRKQPQGRWSKENRQQILSIIEGK